jgi:hypothetical protein
MNPKRRRRPSAAPSRSSAAPSRSFRLQAEGPLQNRQPAMRGRSCHDRVSWLTHSFMYSMLFRAIVSGSGV